MIIGILLLIACIRRPTHAKFTSIMLVIGAMLVLMSIPYLTVVEKDEDSNELIFPLTWVMG
jgi:hypothetical protein